MSRIILAACLTLFISLLPLHSRADETDSRQIGTVAEVEGEVVLIRADEVPANAKVGMQPEAGTPVYMGDTIETWPDSKALLVFIDDTELTLTDNARLTIDEYVFDEDAPEKNKGTFSILNGAFVFVTGMLDKTEKPDVTINTDYGAIGLRGTVVWAGMLDDTYSVFVQEGSVSFANERGKVVVGAGEGTKLAKRGAIPDRARKWGDEKIKRAIQKVTLKNPQAVRARVAQIQQKHAALREHRKEMRNNPPGEMKKEQMEKRREKTQQLQENQPGKRMENLKDNLQEKRENLQDKSLPGKTGAIPAEKLGPHREQMREAAGKARDKAMENAGEKAEQSTGNAAADMEHREKMMLKSRASRVKEKAALQGGG